MDKHERPYKCREPGCDKIRGFTYSGGLLRHQREVHKKNQSMGRELYCQYPNCNRSNSQPFTRQENLKEHIRRRHVTEDVVTSSGLQSVQATSITKPDEDRSRKRKRTTHTDVDDEPHSGAETSDEEEDDEEEDGARTKRRRWESSSLNDRIRELEVELAATKKKLTEANEKLTAANERLRALAGTAAGTSMSRCGG
jgi:TATA-binding protein-associated factor Taf7